MKPLLLLTFAAIALLAACGDDDDGPAADVRGVWDGTYESSANGVRFMCLDIEQDGRDISGTVAFVTLHQTRPLGGRAANNSVSFVWNAGAEESPEGPAFLSSGTFSGTASGESMSGTWSSVDGDGGVFAVRRGVIDSCAFD